MVVDLFYGICLPKKDEKYKITVRWADVELHSKKIEAKNGIIEWYQRLQINTNLPYK